MKCTIPEIAWHNRDPVLSVDIQPLENEFYRLASGGTDCHILIWILRILEDGSTNIEMVSDLTRHQRSVNVVRWSPSGQYLASGDDDSHIIIWTLKVDNVPLLDETNDKETWVINKVLRGHKEDVYDICWSPNELKLLSGSIDNTAILWDFTKGKIEHIITDHKGFVQGVAWDPKGDYVATLSSDRLCRIFDASGKQVRGRIWKGMLPVNESHKLYNKEVKYFHDDTYKSYFRRLTFTPDGNLLITPAGCVETEDCKKALNCTYLFALDNFSQPVAILPSLKQCTIAVRCCPILFELRPDGPDPIINLPYRMIIAVATDSDVILYDTQQIVPFSHLQNIHYTRLTDITWSNDGCLLACSSTDGFCTLVRFETNELGIQYVKEESENEESIMDISGIEELEIDELNTPEKKKIENKHKKHNLLQQWTVKTPKNLKIARSNRKQEKHETENQSEECIIDITMDDCEMEESNETKKEKIDDDVHKQVLANEENMDVSNIKEIENDETKKAHRKPNLLQQLVAKSLRTADNEIKEEKRNTQITEILDSPKKEENVKEKVPKRITPVKIGECSKPLKRKLTNVKSTIKKLREEKIIEETQSQNSNVSSNSIRKQNSSKFLEAKPIAVRRKHKEPSSNSEIAMPQTEKIIKAKQTTPNSNTILNFLKPSSSTPEKNKNTKSDMTSLFDELEARDSWKYNKGEEKPKEIIVNESLDLTEEIPDDFILRVEDSNTADDKIKGTVETQSCSEKVLTPKSMETSKYDFEAENNTNMACATERDANTTEKENSNTFSENDTTKSKDVSDEVKVPHRRVPLITLSGPKHKIKKSS